MHVRTVVLIITAILLLRPGAARAEDRWRIDFETGAATFGYNNVRIPGQTE